MQSLLFDIPSDWALPTEFPNLLDCDVSIDLETRDPWLKSGRGSGWAFDLDSELRGEVIGISIGAESLNRGGPAERWYFPFRHQGGGNLERENVFAWMRDLLNSSGERIFHNALYDCGWLEAEGLEIDYSQVHDTQYMAALINENEYSYSLDSCLKRFLGQEKDEKLLREVAKAYRIDPKSEMWKLHSKYVGPYAEQDAGGTFDLCQRLRQDILKDDLSRVYNLERSLIPILIKTRREGVRIDLDRAAEVKSIFKKKEQDALDEISHQTGLKLRAGVPSKDAASLLRHIGVSVPKTAEGNDSVTADYLMKAQHPLAKLVVRARRYNKAWRDFIDGQIFKTHVNGRIHCTFHPMKSDEGGTVAGRFSCSDPNLQQVPARDPEIGPVIRSCYVGDEGEDLAPLDYSSQEPRWTLHFAGAVNCKGAAEAIRIFRNDPHTDYHEMMANICFPESAVVGGKNTQRRKAKDIFLGMCYGMGGAKLCDTLGLPTDWWETPTGQTVRVAGHAGKEIIKQFNDNAPFVRQLQQKVEGLSKSRGYVRTILGRRCHTEFHHKALNRVIQGSSADQAKSAILEVYTRFKKCPRLLVHDEIVYSVKDHQEAQKFATVMENCIPNILVPFVVDCNVVPNWGAVKK